MPIYFGADAVFNLYLRRYPYLYLFFYSALLWSTSPLVYPTLPYSHSALLYPALFFSSLLSTLLLSSLTVACSYSYSTLLPSVVLYYLLNYSYLLSSTLLYLHLYLYLYL